MARKPLTDEEKQKLVARLRAGKEAKKSRAQVGDGIMGLAPDDPASEIKLPISRPTAQAKELEPDLARPVEDTKATPQQRAKWVRRAFASRGWPNKEHPETVRDFLIQHEIPIIGE